MKGNTAFTITAAIAATLAAEAACILVFVFSGVYDTASTLPHNALTHWLLQTTLKNSLRHRAAEVEVPPLATPRLLNIGFTHYDEMCVSCHGAPGIKPSEIGKRLYPGPPDLKKQAPKLSEREVYYVVAYGIKMTGMPAFAPTHTKEEVWGIATFVKELPRMSAPEYRRLKKLKPEGHHHD